MAIEQLKAAAYQIPADFFETDGTFEWGNTTVVLVNIYSKDYEGVGFTYGDAGAAEFINNTLAPLVVGNSPMDIPLLWEKMVYQVRNVGWRGIAATAISAVDIALWDLKAKMLDLPLCCLFGMTHRSMPVYGSGGFISYTDLKLQDQLTNWKQDGISRFKLKIGQEIPADLKRIRQARNIIGPDAQLYVDANGAYTPKKALEMAEAFEEFRVSWFEEPVTSDDLEGLKFLRERVGAGVNIAAGEYGYEMFYFRRMLEAHAVDVMQADATRCGGFTGFFQAAALCRAFNTPISAHTAPSIHLHAALSMPHSFPMEYFHDHVRIEKIFFDGLPSLMNGELYPNLEMPGLGLSLKTKRIEQFLYA